MVCSLPSISQLDQLVTAAHLPLFSLTDQYLLSAIEYHVVAALLKIGIVSGLSHAKIVYRPEFFVNPSCVRFLLMLIMKNIICVLD